MKTIDELQEEMKKILKKRRFLHSVGVRFTAQSMAMRFGVDLEKAGCAGILHDCAKNMSDAQMLTECKKHNIKCSDTEVAKPSLLHAKLGAYYAKKIYGITDEHVISAIRWHTTGKPSMSNLEKIIYIADFIEPGRRSLPHMAEIRKMAFMDLNQAMFMILDSTLSYLDKLERNHHDVVDSYTRDAYRFYKDLLQHKA